jgi:cytochrome c
MNARTLCLILTASLVTMVHAADSAQAGAASAAKYNCMGCHAVDHKIVGPAFKDVAARYRADKTAEATLMERVRKGTGGRWGGPVAMPAQQIADKDLKPIIQWVLSQK